MHASRRGFTLIELSIVLIIIALVTGMAVTSGISVIAQARYSATQQKIAAIENALLQYRIANDRLPCPADISIAVGGTNYGIEAGSGTGSSPGVGTGVCTGTNMLPAADYSGTGCTNTTATAAEGAIPIVTLGLPNDYMFDGWGNRFRYAVDIAFTAYGAFANTPVGCTAAAITIEDQITTNFNSCPPTSPRSTSAVYAIVSHGANGFGAFPKNGGSASSATTLVNTNSDNSYEEINCHCAVSSGTMSLSTYSPTYVQMSPVVSTSDSYNNFDDIVTYKERWQLQAPWDKLGNCPYVFVTDAGNHTLYKFDINGNNLSLTNLPSGNGTGDGQFSSSGTYPNGIAATSSGILWVVDNNRLESFDTTGNYLNQIPSTGLSNGVTVDSNNYVWLADAAAQTVTKYTAFGNAITNIGSSHQGASGTAGASGTGNGQLNTPYFLVADNNNNIWVADQANNRVQEFDTNGYYLNQINSTSSLSSAPSGVAVNANNQILVTSASNNTVQLCTNTSSPTCTTLVSSGLSSPIGIAVAPNGNIYVVDQGNQKVRIFNSSGTLLSSFGSSLLSSPYGIAITYR